MEHTIKMVKVQYSVFHNLAGDNSAIYPQSVTVSAIEEYLNKLCSQHVRQLAFTLTKFSTGKLSRASKTSDNANAAAVARISSRGKATEKRGRLLTLLTASAVHGAKC